MSEKPLVILDSGLSNAASVKNMFEYLGVYCELTQHKRDFIEPRAIVIPGVGSFDAGMERLRTLSLIDEMNDLALNRKIPVLGICLGMQLLTKRSDEGETNGLGWVDGEVISLKRLLQKNESVPNMGWGEVKTNSNNNYFGLGPLKDRFYFVHSYCVHNIKNEEVIGITKYKTAKFISAIKKNNIMGVQFHPEKSHQHGMQFLKNWFEREVNV